MYLSPGEHTRVKHLDNGDHRPPLTIEKGLDKFTVFIDKYVKILSTHEELNIESGKRTY